MRLGWFLACGLVAGCGAGLSEDDVTDRATLPPARSSDTAAFGSCYAGGVQYNCDQNSPPPGTTTACCATGIAYCCPSSSVCCPGNDTVQSHCCDAAHTCQITGSVTGYFDAYCVPATCGGQSFNGLTQCCSPVSNQPVPKKPIANVADCPGRVGIPGHTATSNGCGTDQHPLPNHYGTANFLPGCDAHDICYGTCGTVKQVCDNNLIFTIKSSCDAAYSSGPKRTFCDTFVALFASSAISSPIGDAAYSDAQKAACQCCA
jgi:hypothetical protein